MYGAACGCATERNVRQVASERNIKKYAAVYIAKIFTSMNDVEDVLRVLKCTKRGGQRISDTTLLFSSVLWVELVWLYVSVSHDSICCLIHSLPLPAASFFNSLSIINLLLHMFAVFYITKL